MNIALSIILVFMVKISYNSVWKEKLCLYHKYFITRYGEKLEKQIVWNDVFV